MPSATTARSRSRCVHDAPTPEPAFAHRDAGRARRSKAHRQLPAVWRRLGLRAFEPISAILQPALQGHRFRSLGGRVVPGAGRYRPAVRRPRRRRPAPVALAGAALHAALSTRVRPWPAPGQCVGPTCPRSCASQSSTGIVPGSTGATATGSTCQRQSCPSRICNAPDHAVTLQKFRRTSACG